MQLFKYTATANQTAFTGADANGAILAFSGNDVDVYLNGVHLDSSDFTASNGDTITLGSGAAVSDELVIRAFRAFTVTDTVSKASGGTFAGGDHRNVLPDHEHHGGHGRRSAPATRLLARTPPSPPRRTLLASGRLTIADGVTVTIASGGNLTIL